MTAQYLKRFLPQIAENPFVILELTAAATSRDVERQGQKLLALLRADIALEPIRILGERFERTEHQVRWAMSELQDPNRRLLYETFLIPALSESERIATLESIGQNVEIPHAKRMSLKEIAAELVTEFLPDPVQLAEQIVTPPDALEMLPLPPLPTREFEPDEIPLGLRIPEKRKAS